MRVISGTSCQKRLVRSGTTPSLLMTPGMPMPTASISSSVRPHFSTSSKDKPAMSRMVASCPRSTPVGLEPFTRILPVSSTTPALMAVPPKSMPIAFISNLRFIPMKGIPQTAKECPVNNQSTSCSPSAQRMRAIWRSLSVRAALKPFCLSRWLRAATSSTIARFLPGRIGSTSRGIGTSRICV